MLLRSALSLRRPMYQASKMRFASFPVTEKTRRKNAFGALLLTCFVSGVYITVINRIKASDDFADILEQEGKK